MAGGYFPPVGDSYDAVVGAIRETRKRVAEVERPDAAQNGSLVAQVEAALANLNATVAAAISANSYTRSVIDSKDASTLASAEAASEAYSDGKLAGAIAPASINSAGDIHGANGYFPSAVSYTITGARTALWIENATGRIGVTTSSVSTKTNISTFTVDPKLILGIQLKQWQYQAELDKQAADPTYQVQTNVGTMAQDIDAAGLWPFVVYARDPKTNAPILDANGKMQPLRVHDALWGYALHLVTQYLDGRVTALEMAAKNRLHQTATSAALSAISIGKLTTPVTVSFPTAFADTDYLAAATVTPPAGLASTLSIAGIQKFKDHVVVTVASTGVAIAAGAVVTVEAIHL